MYKPGKLGKKPTLCIGLGPPPLASKFSPAKQLWVRLFVFHQCVNTSISRTAGLGLFRQERLPGLLRCVVQGPTLDVQRRGYVVVVQLPRA